MKNDDIHFECSEDEVEINKEDFAFCKFENEQENQYYTFYFMSFDKDLSWMN